MGLSSKVDSLLERVDFMGFYGVDEVRPAFKELPEEASETLIEKLSEAGPHGAILIVEWLEEHDCDGALLPLMRFVFDHRHSSESSNARAKAMGAIDSLSDSSDRSRLHAFGLDMVADDDPFVRGHALTLLGKAGGRKAYKTIKQATRDDHPFVRKRAKNSLHRHPRMASKPNPELVGLSATKLAQKARGSSGGELQELFEHLRHREDGLKVLGQLILEDSTRSTIALRELGNYNGPKARRVLGRVLEHELYGARFRIALSTLMSFADVDGLTPVEANAVEQALKSGQRALVCTACRIVRVTEEGAFGPTVCRLLFQDDEEILAAASLALEGIAGEACASLFGQMEDGFRHVHSLRMERPSKALIEAETSLMRALRVLFQSGDVDVSVHRLMDDLFLSMRGALNKPDLFKQAVTLLKELMPPEGFSDEEAWRDRDAALLTGVLGRFPRESRAELVELIRKGSSSDFEPHLCVVARIALDDEYLFQIEDFMNLLVCGDAKNYRKAIRNTARKKYIARVKTLQNRLRDVEMKASASPRRLGDVDGCKATQDICKLLKNSPYDEIRAQPEVFAEIVAPISNTLLGTLFLSDHIAHELRRKRALEERRRARGRKKKARSRKGGLTLTDGLVGAWNIDQFGILGEVFSSD